MMKLRHSIANSTRRTLFLLRVSFNELANERTDHNDQKDQDLEKVHIGEDDVFKHGVFQRVRADGDQFGTVAVRFGADAPAMDDLISVSA